MSELNEFLRVKILLNSPLRTISLKTYYFMQLASNTPIIHNIKLSENKSEILASRFFLQSSNVSNSNDEMIMLGALRKIAANSTIKVIVYNPFFPFIDLVRSSFCFLKILSENFYFQFMEVSSSVLSCLIVGTLIMFFVALILIPNFSTAFWVFFTIVSIEVGVFVSSSSQLLIGCYDF